MYWLVKHYSLWECQWWVLCGSCLNKYYKTSTCSNFYYIRHCFMYKYNCTSLFCQVTSQFIILDTVLCSNWVQHFFVFCFFELEILYGNILYTSVCRVKLLLDHVLTVDYLLHSRSVLLLLITDLPHLSCSCLSSSVKNPAWKDILW